MTQIQSPMTVPFGFYDEIFYFEEYMSVVTPFWFHKKNEMFANGTAALWLAEHICCEPYVTLSFFCFLQFSLLLNCACYHSI